MTEVLPENGSLPSFFVVGAQKAGTTTLYSLLRQHPGIFLPDIKETNFFFWNGREPDFTDPAAQASNRRAILSEDAYRSLYEPARGRLSGEVCSTYLHSTEAAYAIAGLIPDARIIAILREPVSRSFSAYRYMQARGSESASSFEEALAREDQHRADNWQIMAHYCEGSRYAPQLQRYFQAFDQDRVLVIDFDDLTKDSVGVANRVVRWLGLEPLPDDIHTGQTNKTVTVRPGLARDLLVNRKFGLSALRRILPRTYRARLREWLLGRFAEPVEAVSAQTRARLSAGFANDIVEVERLTGLDLSRWKAT